jgi:hypothetical protein
MCAEEIKIEETTCEYCGAQFEVTSTGYCQHCHKVRDADEKGQCRVCGSKVVDLQVQSSLIEEQLANPAPDIKTPEPSSPRPKSSRRNYLTPVILLFAVGLGLYLLFQSIRSTAFAPSITPTPQLTSTLSSVPTTTLQDIPTPSPAGVDNPEMPTSTNMEVISAGASGTAEGRILWNSQPMEGVTIKLCTDWGMFGGCKTQEYTAVTGNDGRFTIVGLPAGEYYFITMIPGQKNETGWFGMNATVVDGQTVTIRDANVIKYDLKLTSPADDATVTSNPPTLTWEAYPGAAYYEVYVADAVMFDKSSVTQYTISEPLAPGTYYWSIKACNAAGIDIAESSGLHFVVAP